MDCIRTEWVVANGKDAIVTSEIEESGKAYVIGINNSIYDWVASHCREEEGRWDGQGRGERREEEKVRGTGEMREEGGDEREGGRGRKREGRYVEQI